MDRMKKIISCNLIRLLAIGLFALMCFQANAQGDRTTQVVDGEKFYMHEVKQGHTLYAISRLYQVEIQEIVDQNPQVEEGLKVGQVLKIRVPDDARADRWDNPIRIKDGYLIHKVKRRETLFGISQEYNVEVNALLELNPSLNEGLKKNQEIKIPRAAQYEEEVESSHEPAEADEYIRHKVVSQETLYSIAKKYEVTVQQIKEVNGGLPDGLKAQSTIKIPRKKADKTEPEDKLSAGPGKFEEEEQSDTVFSMPEKSEEDLIGNPREKLNVVSDTLSPFPEKFKIGVLMPFYLTYLDSSEDKTPRKVQRLQEISMSFYRGVSLAADSLKDWGLNAEFVVTDINDNLSQVVPALEKNKLGDADLVIGPLQRDALKIVNDYYTSSASHVVVPVSQPNSILLDRQNMSEVVPSDITQMRVMARSVAEKHHKDNIILVRGGGIRSKDIYDTFKDELFKVLRSDSILDIGVVKELTVDGKSAEGLEEMLNPVRTNVVVVPCNDRSVIADLIRRMGSVDRSEYKFVLYGTSDWLDFNFFDLSSRNQFNLHLPSSTMIDFESKEALAFIRAYREKFNTEPDQYAFLGYDILRYYGHKMLLYGRQFPNYLAHEDEVPLISTNFDLYKTGVESGFENQFVYILEYRENQLKIAGH